MMAEFDLSDSIKELICNEVNVKEIEFVKFDTLFHKKAKLDFKKANGMYGKHTQLIAKFIENLSHDEITWLQENDDNAIIITFKK